MRWSSKAPIDTGRLNVLDDRLNQDLQENEGVNSEKNKEVKNYVWYVSKNADDTPTNRNCTTTVRVEFEHLYLIFLHFL